jgi:hypothetical protein
MRVDEILRPGARDGDPSAMDGHHPGGKTSFILTRDLIAEKRPPAKFLQSRARYVDGGFENMSVP